MHIIFYTKIPTRYPHHFPIQKFAKMSPSKSSEDLDPIKSSRRARDCLSSSAANSKSSMDIFSKQFTQHLAASSISFACLLLIRKRRSLSWLTELINSATPFTKPLIPKPVFAETVKFTSG